MAEVGMEGLPKLVGDSAFLAPRRCMREPIIEIFEAALILSEAVDAHLSGNWSRAELLISTADMPLVRAWTESLWGSKANNPDQWKYHRIRMVEAAPPYLPKPKRCPVRMPNRQEKDLLIDRYGRNCVFCGIPLIAAEVRDALKDLYPNALSWGRSNPSQHAAFQCLWLQYDHVLPHSRGGDNSIENVVITCAPCNYARWDRTLDEVGLCDPRLPPVRKTSWDGLERLFLAHS